MKNEIFIELSVLGKAIEVLLKHLEHKHGTQLYDLQADYYWEVSEKAKYLISKPTADDLEVGQLSDDWHQITQIANGTKSVLSWDLVAAASLIRYLGEQEVS